MGGVGSLSGGVGNIFLGGQHIEQFYATPSCSPAMSMTRGFGSSYGRPNEVPIAHTTCPFPNCDEIKQHITEQLQGIGSSARGK
ncbi:hypothetical protein PIB30_059595 [Stylosanthes scabra]|uniref:Uncharacterized protein n=1 Tax=Stylosanthes scabra TaxID=79078 RepID=A0ABU6WIM3_9FABA|nr:hypothetical protein [Stylosanthes scabra]